MKEKQHKKNKFPQSGGRYSLQDYYLALKYRNLDTRMQELAWGIIHVIDKNRKSNHKSNAGLLKSILGEYVDVVASWTDGKLELTVTSINIPNELKGAFLPEDRFKYYNPKSKSENKTPQNTRAKEKEITKDR